MPVAGNSWLLSTGIQASLGTPFTTGHMKQRYTGGGGPRGNRNTIELAETDANRVAPDPVVVSLRVEGDSELLMDFQRIFPGPDDPRQP